MENQNYALGMIETIGYPALVAAADAASKAADVRIVTYQGADAGLVTIYLIGDVASVQSAVAVGVEAAKRVGRLHHSHVIARPDENVKKLIFQALSDAKAKEVEKKTVVKEEQPAVKELKEVSDNKSTDLSKKTLKELRELATSDVKFPLSADKIASANKEDLLKYLSATQAGKGGDK